MAAANAPFTPRPAAHARQQLRSPSLEVYSFAGMFSGRCFPSMPRSSGTVLPPLASLSISTATIIHGSSPGWTYQPWLVARCTTTSNGPCAHGCAACQRRSRSSFEKAAAGRRLRACAHQLGLVVVEDERHLALQHDDVVDRVRLVHPRHARARPLVLRAEARERALRLPPDLLPVLRGHVGQRFRGGRDAEEAELVAPSWRRKDLVRERAVGAGGRDVVLGARRVEGPRSVLPAAARGSAQLSSRRRGGWRTARSRTCRGPPRCAAAQPCGQARTPPLSPTAHSPAAAPAGRPRPACGGAPRYHPPLARTSRW